MPNPWDIGSAKILHHAGAVALATTSAGHAGSMGLLDQHVGRDELIEHVEAMCRAVDLPFNVDAEDCFADEAEGVAETAAMIEATDAAGLSIEDWDPRAAALRPIDAAAERVAAARSACRDLVLTARAENHLYGVTDLDDTITRLAVYRDAGADVVYAPGLVALSDIARVVDEVGCPVNVLALPGTPTVQQLASIGVARVSVGSLFAWAAYGALATAAEELLGSGTSTYAAGILPGSVRNVAFGSDPR
ncbi:oxaloacetate decarboxylase [soil metagenome]